MGTYIIAEAGVNHNGSLETALRMVESAKQCGCDCIKFQTFKTERLVTKTAKKADYQIQNTQNDNSQFSMLKALEFSCDDFRLIKQHCDDIGIDFISTPFDMESVDLLEQLGISVYKMSSGDITNKTLLEYVADKHKPIIVSTGMCNMDEVHEAVEWIETKNNHQITLLHCTSNYPAPYNEVNMNAMLSLQKEFSYEIGYSDHTKGIIVPVMAVAMGATVIEKHFTLDKHMEGPDHIASLDVGELKEMVEAIRNVEAAKGDGIKRPSKSEMNTRDVARKSIVLKHAMKKGETLSLDYMEIKRPGTGIPPKYIDRLVGKKLIHDVSAEAILQFEDVDGVDEL